MLMASAAFVAGLHSQDAHAAAPAANAPAANSFDNVWGSITGAVGGLPSLISVAAYIFGILFAVLGVLKIKEHVENPQQTPLKDGAIKLCAGGALFALPFLTEIMSNLVDGGGANTYETQQQGVVMAYQGTG
jgi:hypothetical protein